MNIVEFLNIDFILLIAFLIYGLLCLYNALRLWREGELFKSSILYPTNCTPEACLDPEGFIAFIRPRVAILGGICLAVAAYYFVARYVSIPKVISILQMVLACGAFAWGFSIYIRASKRFW